MKQPHPLLRQGNQPIWLRTQARSRKKHVSVKNAGFQHQGRVIQPLRSINGCTGLTAALRPLPSLAPTMLPREGRGWELGILEGKTQQEQGSRDGHPQLCQARSAMPGGDTSTMGDGVCTPLGYHHDLCWAGLDPGTSPGGSRSPRGQLMPGRGAKNRGRGTARLRGERRAEQMFAHPALPAPVTCVSSNSNTSFFFFPLYIKQQGETVK